MEQRIGKYEVKEKVGEGGFGEVYKVYNTELEIDQAMKILKADFASDSVNRTQFIKEGQRMAGHTHPNICKLCDSDFEHSRPYYITDLYDKNLEQVLNERVNHLLGVQEVKKFSSDILSALQYIHDKSIMHLDIKPSNILIKDGNAVLTDFGISMPEYKGNTTKTESVQGTLDYMALEVKAGKKPDCRADIYSAGVVLYQMITGRMPGINSRPLHELNKDFTEEADRIFRKACDDDRDRRYQTAAEMQKEIDSFVGEKGISHFLRHHLGKFTKQITAYGILMMALGFAVKGEIREKVLGGELFHNKAAIVLDQYKEASKEENEKRETTLSVPQSIFAQDVPLVTTRTATPTATNRPTRTPTNTPTATCTPITSYTQMPTSIPTAADVNTVTPTPSDIPELPFLSELKVPDTDSFPILIPSDDTLRVYKYINGSLSYQKEDYIWPYIQANIFYQMIGFDEDAKKTQDFIRSCQDKGSGLLRLNLSTEKSPNEICTPNDLLWAFGSYLSGDYATAKRIVSGISSHKELFNDMGHLLYSQKTESSEVPIAMIVNNLNYALMLFLTGDKDRSLDLFRQIYNPNDISPDSVFSEDLFVSDYALDAIIMKILGADKESERIVDLLQKLDVRRDERGYVSRNFKPDGSVGEYTSDLSPYILYAISLQMNGYGEEVEEIINNIKVDQRKRKLSKMDTLVDGWSKSKKIMPVGYSDGTLRDHIQEDEGLRIYNEFQWNTLWGTLLYLHEGKPLTLPGISTPQDKRAYRKYQSITNGIKLFFENGQTMQAHILAQNLDSYLEQCDNSNFRQAVTPIRSTYEGVLQQIVTNTFDYVIWPKEGVVLKPTNFNVIIPSHTIKAAEVELGYSKFYDPRLDNSDMESQTLPLMFNIFINSEDYLDLSIHAKGCLFASNKLLLSQYTIIDIPDDVGDCPSNPMVGTSLSSNEYFTTKLYGKKKVLATSNLDLDNQRWLTYGLFEDNFSDEFRLSRKLTKGIYLIEIEREKDKIRTFKIESNFPMIQFADFNDAVTSFLQTTSLVLDNSQ